MTIREKIAEARARLGNARADQILEDAESRLPFGKCLTLAQRLQVLETAMRAQQRPSGIVQQRPSAMVRDDRLKIPGQKTYSELMAEYDAISDPGAKTEYYRKHVIEMKAARVRALYPNAFVLARRK